VITTQAVSLRERHGLATGLGVLVEQQHAEPALRQQRRTRGAAEASADHDHVEVRIFCHASSVTESVSRLCRWKEDPLAGRPLSRSRCAPRGR
jgi:hypothetical protein